MTDEWFQKNTGKTAYEIMKVIKTLIRYAGFKVTKDAWNAYKEMNEMIAKELSI